MNKARQLIERYIKGEMSDLNERLKVKSVSGGDAGMWTGMTPLRTWEISGFPFRDVMIIIAHFESSYDDDMGISLYPTGYDGGVDRVKTPREADSLIKDILKAAEHVADSGEYLDDETEFERAVYTALGHVRGVNMT